MKTDLYLLSIIITNIDQFCFDNTARFIYMQHPAKCRDIVYIERPKVHMEEPYIPLYLLCRSTGGGGKQRLAVERSERNLMPGLKLATNAVDLKMASVSKAAI